jgi:hypothetical protein
MPAFTSRNLNITALGLGILFLICILFGPDPGGSNDESRVAKIIGTALVWTWLATSAISKCLVIAGKRPITLSMISILIWVAAIVDASFTPHTSQTEPYSRLQILSLTTASLLVVGWPLLDFLNLWNVRE